MPEMSCPLPLNKNNWRREQQQLRQWTNIRMRLNQLLIPILASLIKTQLTAWRMIEHKEDTRRVKITRHYHNRLDQQRSPPWSIFILKG